MHVNIRPIENTLDPELLTKIKLLADNVTVRHSKSRRMCLDQRAFSFSVTYPSLFKTVE